MKNDKDINQLLNIKEIDKVILEKVFLWVELKWNEVEVTQDTGLNTIAGWVGKDENGQDVFANDSFCTDFMLAWSAVLILRGWHYLVDFISMNDGQWKVVITIPKIQREFYAIHKKEEIAISLAIYEAKDHIFPPDRMLNS